ncbi:NAD(P)/FAD-dependent oxidoreductase, partial [Candidatus Woesearchaeota archaeon]|nr:NAD(P)/FAD-dependent oxidoreductase [Candidatus Woesearchaeota archaeon]
MYDVIIIGAGPAGMTAGIYCGRYKLNTLIISSNLGGMAADAHKVCNFPSYIEIPGIELMEKVRKQVEALKVPIELDTVMTVEKAADGFV